MHIWIYAHMNLMSNMGEYQTNESPGRRMWEHQQNNKPWETWFFQRGKDISSLPESDWAVAESQRRMTQNELKIVCQGATPWKTGIFLRGRGWALYWRVSELLLSPKEGWGRMKWKVYAKVQRPEKWASSWEEGLSSLPEGEGAVPESQRGMTQDKVKFVCRDATTWKTDIFLRGRIELFTRGWISCCWIPKKNDTR